MEMSTDISAPGHFQDNQEIMRTKTEVWVFKPESHAQFKNQLLLLGAILHTAVLPSKTPLDYKGLT